MQVFIRLYPQADADLIAMRLYEGIRFQDIVRRCIKGFLNPSSPESAFRYRFTSAVKSCARDVSSPVAINLSFREGIDTEAIEWIGTIRKYSRADVIKTIIRSRYEAFPDELFTFNEVISVSVPAVKRENASVVKARIAASVAAKQTSDKRRPENSQSKEASSHTPEKRSPAQYPQNINTAPSLQSAPSANHAEEKGSDMDNQMNDVFDMLTRMMR